jgi:hypothetical protein
MPTVFREKGYRFFFVMADLEEPVHIHVMKGNAIAKCWLNPVRVASSNGFTNHQLREIVEIAKEHEQQIRDSWNERLRNRY